MAVDTAFERATEAQLAQLEQVISEPQSVTIVALDGSEHVFPTQTFSVYKTKEVLKMLAGVREDVDLVQLISEIITLTRTPSDAQGDVERTLAAFSAIPKLMSFAPDLLLDFGAIAIMGNQEVRDAHKAGNLAKLRQDKRDWLEFEFDAAAPIRLLAAYLPHVGINFITAELGKLDTSVVTNFASANQATSTGS